MITRPFPAAGVIPTPTLLGHSLAPMQAQAHTFPGPYPLPRVAGGPNFTFKPRRQIPVNVITGIRRV